MENFQFQISRLLDAPIEIVQFCSEKIKVKNVQKGEFFLQPGEVCNDTFFVNKGLLRMYSIDKNGKEHILHFAPENWILVDRSSLYLNQPSDYYIDAVEPSEVLVLSPEYFDFLAENQPSVIAKQNVLLHKHVSSLQKRITQLLGATAEERYVDFLKTYPNIFERVPQWMVASYLGVTPESLSRVRKELVRKK